MTMTLARASPTARRSGPDPPAVALRSANRVAQQITGRPYLSHSQITLMRTCPRRFAFTYVENRPRDYLPVSLVFGGAIHAAFERCFRDQLAGLTITHEALLSAYHDAWSRQIEQAGNDTPIRFNKNENINTVHALADRMLRAFLASPLATPRGKIIAIEELLTVTLHSEIPDVLARIDLITQTADSLHVVDWKTSRSNWSEQKVAQCGEQLVLYGEVVRSMSEEMRLPVKLHFAIITKHKIPRVQIAPVASAPQRAYALRESVKQVWNAIKTGDFYPNPSPQNCATCPFRSRCPVFSNS